MLYSWYSSTDGNGAMLLECYYSTLRKRLILYTTTFDSEALVSKESNSASSVTRSGVRFHQGYFKGQAWAMADCCLDDSTISETILKNKLFK